MKPFPVYAGGLPIAVFTEGTGREARAISLDYEGWSADASKPAGKPIAVKYRKGMELDFGDVTTIDGTRAVRVQNPLNTEAPVYATLTDRRYERMLRDWERENRPHPSKGIHREDVVFQWRQPKWAPGTTLDYKDSSTLLPPESARKRSYPSDATLLDEMFRRSGVPSEAAKGSGSYVIVPRKKDIRTGEIVEADIVIRSMYGDHFTNPHPEPLPSSIVRKLKCLKDVNKR